MTEKKAKNVIVIVIDTLRRDHIGCYDTSRPSRQLSKEITTPNIDKFASDSVIFDNAYAGSYPCMPARRDLWTGQYEFPFRGWGPMEDDDMDLPGLLKAHGMRTAYVGDHFHMVERACGNYHFGFSYWDMIRGQEYDYISYVRNEDFAPDDLQDWRYGQNQANIEGRQAEEDYFAPQVFRKSAEWLEKYATQDERNKKPFFLMIESFDPHEPFDPPEYYSKPFDPEFEGKKPYCPKYGKADRFTEAELRQLRALYAGEVEMVDKWFGYFMERVQRIGLLEDTMVIISSDHGYYLGEHDLVGKPNFVPMYQEVSHIPMIMYHPNYQGEGLRPKQLVQFVDILPTILDALDLKLERSKGPNEFHRDAHDRVMPEGIRDNAYNLHGGSLLSVVRDRNHFIRKYAFSGRFAESVMVTDGEWAMHRWPKDESNSPLQWCGRREPGWLHRNGVFKQISIDRYEVNKPVQTDFGMYGDELYSLINDYQESINVLQNNPDIVKKLEDGLREWLVKIQAPQEQFERLGL